ncbi:MAG: hypothetical protein H6601_07525 [Flavobacteriales bacterium]|nr:hypothetical protein [Flavobacteriales bacterium]
MDWFTRIVTKLYAQVFVALFVLIAANAMAQDYGTLTVKGDLLCDKKDKTVVSSVTIYRYYHLSQSVELMEQQMVKRSGNFKFNLEFDKEYIIDVASNTGVHKRIHLNTEVMKGYKFENQSYQFAVDVMEGDKVTPEEEAWVYFDPSKNDFDYTDQIPVAFQDR